MRIKIISRKMPESIQLPMYPLALRDLLDRAGTENPKKPLAVQIRSCPEVPELDKVCLFGDIYKLNLLADRIEKLEFPQNYAMRAMASVQKEHGKLSLDGLLLMTYGLDSVPVERINHEKAVESAQAYADGIILDGFYCVPSSYEEPDMKIEIAEPENCFFRLLIAPLLQNGVTDKRLAQWISLPQSSEMLNEIAEDFGVKSLEDCVFIEFQTSLPNLKFKDMKDIYQLNELSKELSELSRHDVIKLKAVMDAEGIHSASNSRYAIGRLHEYDFDITPCDSSDFGRLYLERNLPVDFDKNVLADVDFYEFGNAVLRRKNGETTPYGVISGRGQSLYSAVTVQQEQELAEECAEELSEDEEQDFSMGMEMGL